MVPPQGNGSANTSELISGSSYIVKMTDYFRDEIQQTPETRGFLFHH
jgi:hypothetical protein